MAQRNPRLRLIDIQNVLAAAGSIDSSKARVLELSILTLRPAYQVIAIDLERIDWSAGVAMVPPRVKSSDRITGTAGFTPVYLGNAALATILKTAGSATGKGQAVTAGRGKPISHREIRLDRLQDDIAAAWPEGPLAEWTFHTLRASAAEILHGDGVNPNCLDAALGINFDRNGNRKVFTSPTTLAHGALGRWEQMLFQKRV